MKNTSLISIILFSLISSGCSTNPPSTASRFIENLDQMPGFAKLYIYRPNKWHGSAVWPITYFNNVKVVDLKNDSYTLLFIHPGTYDIRTEKSSFLSGMGNIPGNINIKDTGEYFLKLEIYSCEERKPRTECLLNDDSYNRWQQIGRGQALNEIQKTYRIEPLVPIIKNEGK